MNRIKAYHGTNTRFSQFEQNRARIADDLYGGGVAYFTDELEIAKSYASAMARKFGGEKFIYEVELMLNNVFDVDKVYPGDIVKKLMGKQTDTFARGAGLLRLGNDKYSIYASLEAGKVELTGERLFKGLSNGGVNSARAREALKSAGFDGLRYNGGVNMGGRQHNVYLAYEARDITIKNRFIVSPTPVPHTARNEVYTYIN